MTLGELGAEIGFISPLKALTRALERLIAPPRISPDMRKSLRYSVNEELRWDLSGL